MEERTRFLAAVSHDLRTPLTRLKLRAEKITQDELKLDVQNDINEMASIIDMTLDYLRGDAMPEAACLLDLDALVRSLAEDANESGNGITVTGKVQPDKTATGCDAPLPEQFARKCTALWRERNHFHG